MNKREIQIQFPRPGKWDEFVLTAVYPDEGGFTRTARFTQNDVPAEQAPAMLAVVTALVKLEAPWQAHQVWAQLKDFYVEGKEAEGEGEPMEMIEVIELVVEAIHTKTGGRRIFTSQDYPEFTVATPAAVAFFKYFTATLPRKIRGL